MSPFLTLTAHKFAPLSALKERRARLLTACKEWKVKGSIALSPQGIQLSVAGESDRVEALLAKLRRWPELHDLQPTIGGAERMPFRSMRVRVKQALVFDRRTGAHSQRLHSERPADAWTQCCKCRTPLNATDRAHPHFEPGQGCPYCFKAPAEHMAATIARRHERLSGIIVPLPGSQPRDHFRPISMPAECDRLTLIEALCRIVRHIPAQVWEERCAGGFLLDAQGQPVASTRVVRGGERYLHKFPGLTEPDVDMRVQVIHEDESIVVLNKPAPLPMHAAGRFHRNTLKYVLDALYHPQQLRPAHRLDANTTGVLVASRTQFVASRIQPQFARGEVEKVYLVRVQGHPAWEAFRCGAPISAAAGHIGSRVVAAEGGLAARTDFRVLARATDGSALLEARPLTGRTNQIRVHLWYLGFPVCGDRSYLAGKALGDTQTLGIDEPPLCLHAWRIAFMHPLVKERMTFVAPPPVWVRGDLTD
jgi:RluA family pseudouridine synthase